MPHSSKGGGRTLILYLVLRNRNRNLRLEDFVEDRLDPFLRLHRLEIVSYEVVRSG